MNEPMAEISRPAPARDLLPFLVVVFVAIVLIAVSVGSAVEAQSAAGAKSTIASPLPELEKPEQTLNKLTLRVLPYLALNLVALPVMAAGALLIIFFALKAVIGRRLLPVEWQFDAVWTPLDVLKVAVGALLVTLPISLIFPGGPDEPMSLRALSAQFVIRVVVAVAILGVVWLRLANNGGQASSFALVGLRRYRIRRNIKVGMIAFLCFLVVLICINFLENRVVQAFHLKVIWQEPVELMMSAKSPASQIGLAFLAIIIAPFTEELFFRGFLQGILRKRCGSNPAIFATALLFASAHINAFVFLPLFVLGLMLGYLYDRTQSLAAPIALHACQNASSVFVLVAAKLAQG